MLMYDALMTTAKLEPMLFMLFLPHIQHIHTMAHGYMYPTRLLKAV